MTMLRSLLLSVILLGPASAIASPVDLQAYLGHRNIQHTVRYTELSPTRFKDFWQD